MTRDQLAEWCVNVTEPTSEEDTMSTFPMTYETGVWRFVWQGGRLADVFHAESDTAQDCVQVGEYDFALNHDALTASRAHLGMNDLKAAADEWVAESASDFASFMRGTLS